jgi:hypothetical protein
LTYAKDDPTGSERGNLDFQNVQVPTLN